MILAILANESTKTEILRKGVNPGVEIIWTDSLSSLKMTEADAWFDFEFRNDPERNIQLEGLSPLFIGAMEISTRSLPANSIRINSWPGMLERPIVEITAGTEQAITDAQKILAEMNWACEVTPDLPGFISARVLAVIINEAYFTLEAGTSTKEEIDIAMKLGTNYPIGPFEWGKKVGIKNVYNLLKQISVTDERYIPCTALKNESNGTDPKY